MSSVVDSGAAFWMLIVVGLVVVSALFFITYQVSELKDHNAQLKGLFERSIETIEFQETIHEKNIQYMRLSCEYKLLEQKQNVR